MLPYNKRGPGRKPGASSYMLTRLSLSASLQHGEGGEFARDVLTMGWGCVEVCNMNVMWDVCDTLGWDNAWGNDIEL